MSDLVLVNPAPKPRKPRQWLPERDPGKALVVSWGGGNNSTAALIGMEQRGIVPAHILFADPGSEHQRTWRFFETFGAWLRERGFPEITVVRNDGIHGTLEQECLTNRTLPAIVFGTRSCSDKYKVRPQVKWLSGRYPDLSAVQMAIGYHAGEERRVFKALGVAAEYDRWFPLVEWRWFQEDCLRVIREAGLEPPGKSACTFCPSSTKHDIRRLAVEDPEATDRALRIEAGADYSRFRGVVGLGRHWRWRDVLAADDAQLSAFTDPDEAPCGCWDGGDDE